MALTTLSNNIAQMGGMPGAAPDVKAGLRAGLRERLARYLHMRSQQRSQDQMQGLAQLVMLAGIMGKGGKGKPQQPAAATTPVAAGANPGPGAPVDPAAATAASGQPYQPWWKLMHDDRYNGGY